MLCPKCHTQNRDNAKFCKGCGLSFTPEMLAAAQTESVEAEQAQSILSTSSAQEQSVPTSSAQESQAASPATTQAAVATDTAPTAASEEEPVDDISRMPTQILTPQQMLAYHTKRWQQELEREQHGMQGLDEEQRRAAISNTPTVLFASPGQDVGDLPTVFVPPANSAPLPPPPPAESLVPESGAEPETNEDQPDSAVASAVSTAPETAPVAATGTTSSSTAAEAPANEQATTSQEDIMEQVTPGEQVEQSQAQEQQAQQEPQVEPAEQAAQTTETGNFPVLDVGTTLEGRYEIAQVINDAQEEHIYLVIDHQGYQRCWNCSSPENTAGDEFCIDCGAELLNASYTMHEYPAQESKNNEENVLQGVIVNTFVEQGHTYVIEQPHTVQNAFPNGVHLLAASDSDAGNVRRGEPNEDSTLVLQLQRVHESIATPNGVFIVADGMGGHANGQGASLMTISMISERMVRDLLTPSLVAEKNSEEPKQLDEEGLVTLLNGAVEDANAALCQANQREKSDMGSTITGFMIVGDHAYILNVGDSRTYMLREGKLHQLTTDHSLVGQLVAGGLIEPDDVYTHPQRSQIYRSLGDKLNVQVDIFKQQVYPEDVLLSCSDGLWEMIRNPQITEILSNAPDPQTACTHLIETANANGGEDNVSAVVVFVR